MKRLLHVLILLVILGASYAPFAIAKEPAAAFGETRTKQLVGGAVEISKYGGESKLTLGKSPDTSTTRVEIITQSGGVKYNWVLSAYPGVNVFTMPLVIEGATYYYQPPLDAKAYPKGWTANATHVYDDKGVLREYRPVDVVGSYAVYGLRKDNEYGTGKICHIYRPLIIAADGKTTWGTMLIEGGALSVTVDDAWLKKAKYPVTVDPTFGTTGVGGSDLNFSGGLYGTQTTSPNTNSVVISSMTAYVKNVNSYEIRCGVWVNSDGGAVVGYTGTPAAGAAYSWITAAATAFSINPNTNYMLGILGWSSDHFIKYDTGTGGTGHRDGSNNFSVPEPFNWTDNNDYILSIYATYYSAPTITSSVISDMDDTDNLYTMKKYYTFTTVIADSDGGTDIRAISVRGAQGASVRFMVNATALDTVPVYTLVTGASTTDLDGASCTWAAGAGSGTLVLKIRLEWDATSENDCELEVWARDILGNTVGWTIVHSDYYDVISRLVTHDFAANVTSTTINVPVAISGLVRYATTNTGNTASSSYPPNAQFIGVAVKDDQGTMVFNDTTIANGAFGGSFNTSNLVRTSFYYAYITMQPDYTPGLAPDGDYVTITTSPDFNILAIVQQGFAYWGTTFATVNTVITAFATWFTDSATAIIDMVTGMLTLIIYIAGTVTSWVARMANFFVNLLTFINTIFDGTIGGHNIWTEFNIAALIDIIPVIAFIIWFGGIPLRARRGGVSELEILVRDLQIASWIIGEVWNWTFTVFNTVVNLVMTFVGTVTG